MQYSWAISQSVEIARSMLREERLAGHSRAGRRTTAVRDDFAVHLVQRVEILRSHWSHSDVRRVAELDCHGSMMPDGGLPGAVGSPARPDTAPGPAGRPERTAPSPPVPTSALQCPANLSSPSPERAISTLCEIAQLYCIRHGTYQSHDRTGIAIAHNSCGSGVASLRASQRLATWLARTAMRTR